MNGEEFKECCDFDANLQIGQEVVVRWTHSHGYYSAKAKISKLNQKSVKAELLEAVDGRAGVWPVGFNIKVPRFADIANWTVNNSVWKE